MADGTLKVENIQTSSGSGTITLGQSGETVTVPSGATLDMTNATMSLNSDMKNTPAFFATLTADVTLADGVFTTVPWNNIVKDTHNAFDTSNYRFTCPSGNSGTYYIGGMTLCLSGALTQASYSDIYLRKNGSNYLYQMSDMRNNYTYQIPNPFGVFMDLDDGDYVDIQVRLNVTTSTGKIRGNTLPYESNIYGYKLIGA